MANLKDFFQNRYNIVAYVLHHYSTSTESVTPMMTSTILTIAVLLALVISIFTGKHYYDSHRYIQLYYVAEDSLNAAMDDQLMMTMMINLRYPLLLYLDGDEIFVHSRSRWQSPFQSIIRSYAAAPNESLLHHRFTFINASDGESQLKQYLTNHLYINRTSNSTSSTVAVCSMQKDTDRSAFIYNAIHQFDDLLETMKVIIDDGYVDRPLDNMDGLMRCRQVMDKDLIEGIRGDRSIQHAPLTYKINLVLASEQQLVIGRQHNQAYDVVTTQLIRSIDQLLTSPSGLHTHAHVYRRRHYRTGLSGRYRYRYRDDHSNGSSSSTDTVKDTGSSSNSEGNSIRYLSPGDVLQYMESDESIYQSSVAGSECTRPQLCTEFTIVYYAPSYSHNLTDDVDDHATHTGHHGRHNVMHIVDDPKSIIYSSGIDGDHEGIEQQDYASSGVVSLRKHGCFIVFDFNDLPETVRNSHLHSVMELSRQCLRRMLGMSTGVHIDIDRGKGRDRGSLPYGFARSEIDLFVQRSMEKTRRAVHTCMRQSLELQGIHSLSNNSPPIDDVLRQVMVSIQLITSNSFGSYRSLLGEYYQLLKDYESFDDALYSALSCLYHCDEGSCDCALTPQVLMTRREQLWSQLRSVHRSCQQLTTSPDGSLASRIHLPSELYFAVYGPYWLPLLLPAFRLIRTYL